MTARRLDIAIDFRSLLSLKSRIVKLNDYSNLNLTAFNFRGKLLAWVFKINTFLEADLETFFKTVKIFDYFLSRTQKSIEIAELRLYIAVCYFIAFKLEEVKQMNIEILKNFILNSKYSDKKLIEIENIILKTINFKLNLSQTNNFTDFFLENIFVSKISKKSIQNLILYVNLTSLIVEDFIFDFSDLELAIFNIKIVLKLLIEHQLLSREELKQNLETINLFNDSNSNSNKELVLQFYNLIKAKISTEFDNILNNGVVNVLNIFNIA